MKKRLIKLGVFIVIVIVLILGIYYLKTKNDFTVAKWEKCDDSKRYKLIESFEEQYNIIGMTRDEVESLLGKTNFFSNNEPGFSQYRDFDDEGADEYCYYKIKNDMIVGWKIYIIGFKDGIVIDKSIALEDW